MNFRLISRILGATFVFEALAMVLCAAVSLIYGEAASLISFLLTIAILLAIGIPLYLLKSKNHEFYISDGFASVALVWISMSLFGALPFVISGEIPKYVDALFECISGFTTTGASILQNVELMSHGMLFWRSITIWIGGMGVLVLALAFLPLLGARSIFLMQAEAPGPTPGKLVPKIGQTARILYLIYILMSLVECMLLLIAGMPLFDAIIHTFATAGTGGFSSKALSVAAYNNVYIEMIIAVFMALFGVNFTVYFYMLRRKSEIVRNEEVRFYFFILLISILAITPGILQLYGERLGDALRYSFFQVSSIITTTGFATADYNVWPMYCRAILLLLMVCGACAGSTGGGLKTVRLLLLFKAFKRELRRILHPRASMHIMLDGVIVKDEVVSGISNFFFAYIGIIVMATFLVSFDGFDFMTTFSSVLSAIGNIGPGMELTGPLGNYAMFSPFSKVVLSVCMLAGRLEIMPIMVFLIPSYWTRGNH